MSSQVSEVSLDFEKLDDLLRTIRKSRDDINPLDESSGVKVLFHPPSNDIPHQNIRHELVRLTRHLLDKFTNLIQGLGSPPCISYCDLIGGVEERVNEMHSIFINIYHLINLLKPHQSLASIKHSLQIQINEKQARVDSIHRLFAESQQRLSDLQRH
ncbi:Mediator of RNA polymerase II transcription subunit 7 [Mitosporidium daphniae]